MKRKIVSFELRKQKDDDIEQALEDAAKRDDKAAVIRAALRFYLLGGTNTPTRTQKRARS